jgi:hypothetical protein
MAENKEDSVIEGFRADIARLTSLIKELNARMDGLEETNRVQREMIARMDSLEETNRAQREMIEELLEQIKSVQQDEPVALDPKDIEGDDGMDEDDEAPKETPADDASADDPADEPEGEKGDDNQATPEAQTNEQTDGQQNGETEAQTNEQTDGQPNGETEPQQQNGQTNGQQNGGKSQQSNEQTNGQQNGGKSPQSKQSNLKLVDRNGNKQFVATDEFTEEQLAEMHRSMQADRARTQQLFNHVTSPYLMHGSAGETAAMAIGSVMGFALGRSMYKVSRVGHLRQDWKLRREVLRQERGAYGQGGQSRLDTLRQGFSNAASAFTQGFRRGRRSDIDMNMSAQTAQPVQPEQRQQPAEKAKKVVVTADADMVSDDEDTLDVDFESVG